VFLVKTAPMNLPTPVLQVELRHLQFQYTGVGRFCCWALVFKNDAPVPDSIIYLVEPVVSFYDVRNIKSFGVRCLQSSYLTRCHTHKAMVDLWAKYMKLVEDLGIDVPKAHLMVHVNHRARAQGNPWRYTTFLDESLNKELKRVLRLCHQANFETLAMAKLSAVLDKSSKRQRTVG
jgi:hypothetical protein